MSPKNQEPIIPSPERPGEYGLGLISQQVEYVVDHGQESERHVYGVVHDTPRQFVSVGPPRPSGRPSADYDVSRNASPDQVLIITTSSGNAYTMCSGTITDKKSNTPAVLPEGFATAIPIGGTWSVPKYDLEGNVIGQTRTSTVVSVEASIKPGEEPASLISKNQGTELRPVTGVDPHALARREALRIQSLSRAAYLLRVYGVERAQ